MNDAQSESIRSTESKARPYQGGLVWLWRWFWRVTLVVSLAYAWYCFYVPSNNVAWAMNYAEAQEQAVKSGKLIVLFFTGKWCVPCRIMKRNVWADERVAAIVNTSYIAVTIDVGDPEAAAALSRYSVASTPKTIITDSQGNVLQQKDGGMSKADFLELLANSKSSSIPLKP
jgi:protein disulfide-isomerase